MTTLPSRLSAAAIAALLCLGASVALAAPPPGKGKPDKGGATPGTVKCVSDAGKRHSAHLRCATTATSHVLPELFDAGGALQSGWSEVFTEQFVAPPVTAADRSGTFDVTRWSSRLPWGDWRANGVTGEDHWNVNTSGHDPGVGWVEGNFFPDMERFIGSLEANGSDVFSRTATGLSIRAHRNPWKNKINGRKPYVAGTLSTHVKPSATSPGTHGRQWRYGYFEVRAKMPRQGNGFRSAIWLYADNAFYNDAHGAVGRDEIDIAEYIANTRAPNPNDASEECFVQQTSSFWPNVGSDGALSYDSLFHTYHPSGGSRTSSNWVYNAQSPYDAIRCDDANGPDIIDFGAAYHSYGVLWEHDRIEFYVDRRLVHQVREDGLNPSGHPANLTENGKNVYDGTMYLIINLALGLDGFEGAVDGAVLNTPEETAFDIDYVKVWQRRNADHGWCGKGGSASCLPGELTIPD